MGRRRRKKKRGNGTIVFLLLVIIAGIGVLFLLEKDFIIDRMKDKVGAIAADQVAEKAFETILQDDPEAAQKAKEIVNSMDETDKEQVMDIVGKYANSETVSEVMDIIRDDSADSVEQAKEYLQESVSEEDLQKLEELYQKYTE